jgi:hypothetical protein
MRKVITYINQFGKLCEVISNGEAITVEETECEAID